jgi:peptide/nickel transport system substrate-binding protein
MLSVVTKAQWCSWSDTGWDSPEFDALYNKQGTTIDPEERKQIVWEMQQMIYDTFLYTQLVNLDDIEAHTKAWDGFSPALDAYSKKFYSQPHKVG